MSTFSRATQSRSVSEKKKTCSSRWIILCTPQCAAVARDHLPDVEVGGLTASRTEAGGLQSPQGGMQQRGRTRRLLLWWSRPSSSSRRRCTLACTHCCSVVRTLSIGVRRLLRGVPRAASGGWRVLPAGKRELPICCCITMRERRMPPDQ
jgi:hypothetical protein